MGQGRGQLEEKVALVTGATSGLGAAAARALAAQGAAVVLAGRRAEQGAQVAQEICAQGGQARFVRTDVTDESQVANLVQEAVRAYGRLDIAFNNAGGNRSFGPLETIQAQAFMDNLTTNLVSVFYSLKHEIPVLREAGGGSIINTASTAGVKGASQNISGYIAAKHGVIGLTRAAALEQARNKIRVNALVLGPVATEQWRVGVNRTPGMFEKVSSSVPLGRVAGEEDITPLILFLASDAASFITGAAIAIDGGVTAG